MLELIKNFFRNLFKKSPQVKKEAAEKNPIDEAIEASSPKPSAPIGDVESRIGDLVEQELKNYPNLLKYNSSPVFWKNVFKAMAYAESSFNLTSRYVETGIPTKDLVTGKHNTSEGLFQLSYQDSKIHGAPFNWELDKNKGPLDPTKTIFDLRNNTIGAMIILNKQLGKGLGLITKGNPYYWAVLDTSRPGHKRYLEKFEKLNSKISEVPPVINNPSSSESKIKNVAIIIGHGAGDSGAVGNGTNEFAYNSKVAQLVLESKEHGKNIKLFWRDSRGISGVNGDVKKYNDDLSIELHLNSYNGSAKGCEVLTLAKDEVSIKIARDFSDKFCAKFNRIKRDGDGVKELNPKDRGHYSLLSVNDPPPSILVEPFFIDNTNEFIQPEVYAKFIIEWLKVI